MDLQAKRNGIRKKRRNSAFWDLVACALGHICLSNIKYIHKELCMTSFQTGEKLMHELLNGHEKRCFNMFRMTQSTLQQLCMDLESKYGLLPSDRIPTFEKVSLFVYILSKEDSNRDA